MHQQAQQEQDQAVNNIIVFVAVLVAAMFLFTMGLNKFFESYLYVLKQWLIHGQQPETLAKVLFYGQAAISFTLASLALYAITRKKTIVELLDGNDWMTPKQFNKYLGASRMKGEPKGIVLGEVELPYEKEFTHFLLEGLPGSGKSVTIINMLTQAIERNDTSKIIIHDPKGSDFYSWVPQFIKAKTGKQTILFAPWEENSWGWAIGKDVYTPTAAGEVANKMMPDEKGDNHFVVMGRMVLKGLICSCIKEKGKDWSFVDLSDLLSLSGEEIVLIAMLGVKGQDEEKGELDYFTSHVGKDETGNLFFKTKQAADWIPNIQKTLGWVHRLAARERKGEFKNKFSVKAFKNSKKVKAMILVKHDSFKQDNEAIYGGLFAMMRDIYNSPENMDTQSEGGLWMILDEYPLLGKGSSEAVIEMQQLGRSKGCRSVIAYQAESQLVDLFGKDKAMSQINMQKTQIYGTLSEDAAKRVSDKIGKKTEMIKHVHYVAGGEEKQHTQQSEVVKPHELKQLTVHPKKGYTDNIVVIGGTPCKIKSYFSDIPSAYKKGWKGIKVSSTYEHYVDLGTKAAVDDFELNFEDEEVEFEAEKEPVKAEQKPEKQVKKQQTAQSESEDLDIEQSF